MAQWYAQLVFRGDVFLGEGMTDLARVEGVASANGDKHFTTVIVSGYALYGELRGYYALGVAHLVVDPDGDRTHYVSEESALHNEPVDTLTPTQRTMIRDWLISFSRLAWENSTVSFRKSLS